ncbi:two-component system histidine kinase PnpS [Shouchella shacheensis]|uniref:two-component system histidine kinase PnpS n=1 Tax=Shouchella shacheensis TaxID=1649580 RepID=UPI00073FE004|nr:ATP-binding protein [Shouchella shacheensis]
MSKLRNRFIVSVISVIALVLIGLGIVLGYWYNERYMDVIGDRLEQEAGLASWTVLENGFPDEAEARELAVEIGDRINARVTILEAGGEVIGDTWGNEATMDNHGTRPEIRRAETGEGFEVRYSETIGADLMYYANPLYIENELVGYLRVGLTLGSLYEMSQTVWAVIGVSFLLAFVIILALIARISRQILRPIDEATKAAIKLAEGDYKTRTYEDQHKELGQLGRSINVLAYNLEQITRRHQSQQDQMSTLIDHMGSGLLFMNVRGDIVLMNKTCEHIFQVKEEDWLTQPYYHVLKDSALIAFIQAVYMSEAKQRDQIEVREGYTSKIYDVFGAPVLGKKARLRGVTIVMHDITEQKKLEQVRKDFVANVSHELKTPVTSIKGFTETLLDGALKEPELAEQFTGIIWKESDRLQSLISDLLDLSKIEDAHFMLDFEEVQLAEVAREAVALLESKAAEKEMELALSTEGSSFMEGDSQRLKQIVLNLVTNAIAYSPKGGKVDVRITEENETVRLHVADTGIGIGEEEVQRIFERFYRVDRARSRNSGGTGLGLAIVKHLAEAHHATIQVESEVGEGTEFILTFSKRQSNKEHN